MAELTDLEVSKALALVIGYTPDRVWATSELGVLVHRKDGSKTKVGGLWQFDWRIFDYRDWNVIGPIAERYDAFPCKPGDVWVCCVSLDGPTFIADTPQKAIALAVIGAKT